MRYITGSTFLELQRLLTYCEQLNLRVVHEDLVKDISNGCKYTSMVTQRNLLEHLVKSGGVTHKIRELAKKKYMPGVRVRNEEVHTL